MKIFGNKKLWMLLMAVFAFQGVSAQKEYLVKVYPNTGAFSIVDSLHLVHWITVMPHYSVMDEMHHRYIFRGADSLMNNFLYTVDASSGAILSSPSFPQLSDPADNVIELEFDNMNGNLYGLHWDASEQREYFVTINPTTAAMTLLDSIPYLHYIAVSPTYTAYDQVNHRYYFQGIDDFGAYHLYGIDALTGHVVSSPSYPPAMGNIFELRFDNTTQSMYGLYRDNVNHHIFLVNMNPVTLATTVIDSITGLYNTVSSPHYCVFDQVNRHYIFLGMDQSWQNRLYTINVNNAQVISNPLFPLLMYSYENVIELETDNTTGEFFALHWGVDKLVTGTTNTEKDKDFMLYPNPFTDRCTMAFANAMPDLTVFVYDVSGKVVRTIKDSHTSTLVIERNGLPGGLYFISVNSGNFNLGLRKIVIE